MKASMKLLGADKLTTEFTKRKKKAGNASVIVGYTANYAIYVHEMVDANFKRPGAQAKFLEQPAREIAPKVPNIVTMAMRGGATLGQALVIAGLQLQRMSQKVVPIDTGNLRASAFTRQES